MEPRGREQHRWQTDRSNGAYGKSDIEGKTAREAASELGKERVSNERERMSQSVRSSRREGGDTSKRAARAKFAFASLEIVLLQPGNLHERAKQSLFQRLTSVDGDDDPFTS